MSDDPYAALGLTKTATEAEIKKAYKRIARESHPDLNPGDPKAEARFKAASSAHDLLKDPERRARFDRGEIDAQGHDKPERRFYREYAEGPEATYHTSRGFEDIDMSDVFSISSAAAPRAAAGAAAASPPAARTSTSRWRSASSTRSTARRSASRCPAAGRWR